MPYTGYAKAWLYASLSFLLIIPNFYAFISMKRTCGLPMNIKIPTMNLIISDILLGLSLFVRSMVRIALGDDVHHSVCLIQMTWTLTVSFASMLIVASIAIDRCICLYHEHAYITKVTVRKVGIVQISIWMLALLYAIVVFVDYTPNYSDCFNMYAGTFGRSFQLCMGIIGRVMAFLSYIFIFAKILRMTKADKSLGMSSTGTFHTTYKLLLIGIVFHVMYFPYLCYTFYLVIHPDEIAAMESLYIVASVMTAMNSFINPFIYAWRFPECRLEVKKMLCFFNKTAIENENEKKKRLLVSFLDVQTPGIA